MLSRSELLTGYTTTLAERRQSAKAGARMNRRGILRALAGAATTLALPIWARLHELGLTVPQALLLRSDEVIQ